MSEALNTNDKIYTFYHLSKAAMPLVRNELQGVNVKEKSIVWIEEST